VAVESGLTMTPRQVMMATARKRRAFVRTLYRGCGSFAAVAAELGISRQRVQQIVAGTVKPKRGKEKADVAH
jgi:DNA-directed RNA polymerase sigma subunit (sigma70/sigma32)